MRRPYFSGVQKVAIGGFISYVGLLLFMLVGWIIDICHIIYVMIHSDTQVTGLTLRLALETIGVIVPPLGALMGWLHVFF